MSQKRLETSSIVRIEIDVAYVFEFFLVKSENK